MNFKFLCGIILLSMFLFPAWTWADVDTLRPTADVWVGDINHWRDYPDAGGRWDDIDDVTSDGDNTYLYEDVDGHGYIYRSDDWSGSGTIDSIRAFWVIRKAEAFNLFQVAIGRAYNEEGFWVTCGTLDSVTETTQSYTTYSMGWALDPCTGEAWSTTYLNHNSFGFGIKHAGGISSAMGRFTQAYFIVYSSEEAQADSIIIRPDGDEGTNDWTPTNCVDHYDCVNEADESSYLSEATQFEKDRWTMQDVSGTLTSGQMIDSVVVTYRAQRDNVTTINIALYIGSDKTWAGVRDPGASWTTYSQTIEVPGNFRGYWTVGNLDNLDVVINKTGDDANTVDVCEVYVTVYYTPGKFIRLGAESGDDGQETSTGYVNTNFIYIELMRVMTPQRYYAAYRFPNIMISQGATINSAYIGLGSYGAPFYNPIDTIACEDVDSTTILEGGSITWDISERWANATSAVVFWDEDDVGDTPGVPDSTPDLKTLVQEIVDRPGWESGNALTFLFRNMIIGLDSCQYETHSWDGSGNELGGVLLIEYEEAVVEAKKYLRIRK